MADFEISYAKTAKVEGGYTKNPEDNGNWTGGRKGLGQLVGTNYGISAPDMSAYLKRIATEADMRNMPISVAKSIYKKNYWNVHSLDDINCQRMADEIYDTGVNCGIATSGKFFQRCLNLLTRNNLFVDGKVGPKTIALFNTLKDSDKYLVWKLFNALQGSYYIAICERNEKQEIFIRSWGSRVFES